jgi:hypothetical protein
MVADALEADWNARLRQLDTLQQEHDRQRKADEGYSATKRVSAFELWRRTSPWSGVTIASSLSSASACSVCLLKT